MAKPYFEIVEGSDGYFRINLADKYARKFVYAIGGFISPAFKMKDEAERIGWTYISESSRLKQMRRQHTNLVAEQAAIDAAQTSLF